MRLKTRIKRKLYRKLHTLFQIIGRRAWKIAEWSGRQSGKMCEKLGDLDYYNTSNLYEKKKG